MCAIELLGDIFDDELGLWGLLVSAQRAVGDEEYGNPVEGQVKIGLCNGRIVDTPDAWITSVGRTEVIVIAARGLTSKASGRGGIARLDAVAGIPIIAVVLLRTTTACRVDDLTGRRSETLIDVICDMVAVGIGGNERRSDRAVPIHGEVTRAAPMK